MRPGPESLVLVGARRGSKPGIGPGVVIAGNRRKPGGEAVTLHLWRTVL